MTDDVRLRRAAQLGREFALCRPRLVRVAYAVLGSHAEAEDAVSDCWLRLIEADRRDPVRDVEAWAVVVVARRALDVLRLARVQRELYVGPWLPEPLLGPDHEYRPADPADRITLDESVSFALMVVLETLSPAERTAWVLHDLFGLGFAEIAEVVGRTPAAVRQLASRARRHVADGAPRRSVSPNEHAAVLTAFIQAASQGDLNGLLAVLDPAVSVTSDGGGQVSAALRPVLGAERVARFIVGVLAKSDPDQRLLEVMVNGSPGLATVIGDRLTSVASFTVTPAGISRIDVVRAPHKLPDFVSSVVDSDD